MASVVYVNPSVTAYADSSPASGGAFWCALQTLMLSLPHRGRWLLRSKRRKELACPERGGGCECNEQTEGLYRGFCCLRQPLSQSALRRIASSPAGEPFWCALQTPAQLRRAANDGPYSVLYKPLAKTRGRTASPQLYNLLRSPAVRRISHGGAIFHIAQAIFHCALAQFHCGRKPAYIVPVTTTVVTPGVTLTTPVAVFCVNVAAGTVSVVAAPLPGRVSTPAV